MNRPEPFKKTWNPSTEGNSIDIVTISIDVSLMKSDGIFVIVSRAINSGRGNYDGSNSRNHIKVHQAIFFI